MDQFNSGWRARDDLPCEPNHHVERVRVGDRAGDENIRSVAVPFIGCRSTIHGCRKGDIGERRFRGFVRVVGVIGRIVDHWSGLQGVRSGETWNVEGRGFMVQCKGQSAIIGSCPQNGEFVTAHLSGSIAQLFTA